MCTGVVLSAQRSFNGRPLLMKHRDIPYEKRNHGGSHLRYFEPSKGYRVLAVTDGLSQHAFLPLCGMNECGFTILNTATFNLGVRDFSSGTAPTSIMAQALASCQNADEFELVLRHNSKGVVPANYLVSDKDGKVSLFETSKTLWTRVDSPETANGFYAFTNFSQSGDPTNQAGLERCATARKIMAELLSSEVTLNPHNLVDSVSRSLRSELLQVDFKSQTWQGGEYFPDGSFIPLKSTTFSVVFCGDVLWCALGYPPVSPLVPIPFGTKIPPMMDELYTLSRAMRNSVFDVNYGEGNRYLNIKRLYNSEGTGAIQRLALIEEWAVNKFEDMRKAGSLDLFYQQYAQKIKETYYQFVKQACSDDVFSQYRLCAFDEKKDLTDFGQNKFSRLSKEMSAKVFSKIKCFLYG